MIRLPQSAESGSRYRARRLRARPAEAVPPASGVASRSRSRRRPRAGSSIGRPARARVEPTSALRLRLALRKCGQPTSCRSPDELRRSRFRFAIGRATHPFDQRATPGSSGPCVAGRRYPGLRAMRTGDCDQRRSAGRRVGCSDPSRTRAKCLALAASASSSKKSHLRGSGYAILASGWG